MPAGEHFHASLIDDAYNMRAGIVRLNAKIAVHRCFNAGPSVDADPEVGKGLAEVAEVELKHGGAPFESKLKAGTRRCGSRIGGGELNEDVRIVAIRRLPRPAAGQTDGIVIPVNKHGQFTSFQKRSLFDWHGFILHSNEFKYITKALAAQDLLENTAFLDALKLGDFFAAA